MANLEIRDGADTQKFLKATGVGSLGDPTIPEHTESNSAAIRAAVEILDNAIAGTEMRVDVVSTVLPTGVATAANQTTIIGHLDGVEAGLATLLTTANFDPKVGALTETAPASDTASSGLNGRLQRIAQRLTSLIALLPTALTAGGNLKTALQEAIPAGTNNIGDVDVLTLPALSAGTNNIGDVDVLSVSVPTAFYMGQKVVATAGTELALAASQALLSGVTIKALHANTGWIYIGTNPVTLTTGFVLDAGEQIFIEIDNLSKVYVDCSFNGEGVSYIAS